MTTDSKAKVLRELQGIPGVGRAIANDLWKLRIRRIADLRGRAPQKLYDDLCQLQGQPIDRCMLYVLRCAVYFASRISHDPELLKWWNWKDPTNNSTARSNELIPRPQPRRRHPAPGSRRLRAPR
jgi:Pathogenicity locus